MAAQAKKSDEGMVVLAPLVQAKVGGRVLHFYKGDTLPDGTDEKSVKNLRSLGYLGTPETDEK